MKKTILTLSALALIGSPAFAGMGGCSSASKATYASAKPAVVEPVAAATPMPADVSAEIVVAEATSLLNTSIKTAQ